MSFSDIVSYWQGQFPILSPYTPPTLFAKADIMLIGLRLDKVMSNSYRVILEILPLWLSETSVNNPIFYDELLTNRGLQIFIQYKLHDPLLSDYVERQKMHGVTEIDKEKFELERKKRLAIIEEAVECAHERFGAVLQEDVKLSDIFQLINSAPIRGVEHNPLYWTRIFELKMALACYFGRTDMIKDIKTEVEKESRYWDKKRFADLFHGSIDDWKNALYQRMENREGFMTQVELNMSDKRIAKLNPIHISDDVKNYKDVMPGKPFLQKLKSLFSKL